MFILYDKSTIYSDLLPLGRDENFHPLLLKMTHLPINSDLFSFGREENFHPLTTKLQMTYVCPLTICNLRGRKCSAFT